MASCFNATYHKTSLAETSEVKELMKNTLRPENIDMIVRKTNNGLFSLKDPAMPIIRSRDAKLQEAQGALIKSSYITMKLAEDLDQAHAKGDINHQLYDKMSRRVVCIICYKKGKSKRKISDRQADHIRSHLIDGFTRDNEDFPAAICESCSILLNKQITGNDVVLPTVEVTTLRGHDHCCVMLRAIARYAKSEICSGTP